MYLKQPLFFDLDFRVFGCVSLIASHHNELYYGLKKRKVCHDKFDVYLERKCVNVDRIIGRQDENHMQHAKSNAAIKDSDQLLMKINK